MHNSGQNSQSKANTEALPLFRAEALAARQNIQGEILMLRPFSLLFLSWLGVFLVSMVLAFLFIGRYTPRTQVKGIVIAGSSQSASRFQVALDLRTVSATRIDGEDILVRCTGCGQSFPAKVVASSGSSTSPFCDSPGCATLITVAFPSEIDQSLQNKFKPGDAIEADIPGRSQRLVTWLLEKPGH